MPDSQIYNRVIGAAFDQLSQEAGKLKARMEPAPPRSADARMHIEKDFAKIIITYLRLVEPQEYGHHLLSRHLGHGDGQVLGLWSERERVPSYAQMKLVLDYFVRKIYFIPS